MSYTHFWSVVGPRDLNSTNVWNLTTPALKSCFGQEGLSWNQFASKIAEEKHETIPAQQCRDYSDTLYPSGYTGLVFLAENLTVNDGGNASILAGSWYNAYPFAERNRVDLDPDLPELNCIADLPDPSNTIHPHISGCLAFKGKEHCQLLYNPSICAIISIATLAKVIAMFFAARVNRHRAPPLLTTGDAVASFIERPDNTTKRMCWASSRSIQKGHWKYPSQVEGRQVQDIAYRNLSRRKQWRKTSSVMRWLVTSIW